MEFYKEHDGDKTQWAKYTGLGQRVFRINGGKVYNLFRDYPEKIDPDDKKVFDRQNPFWKRYFEVRK